VVEAFNWQHLSGIGAVLTRAEGRRPRWLLALHRGSVRSAQVARFLQALRRHRRRPLILLWDRAPARPSYPPHVQQAFEGRKAWLRVEWLPAYAPELNPVEQLRAHFDATTLANTPADDLGAAPAASASGCVKSTVEPRSVVPSLLILAFFDSICYSILKT
jgi:hypothetical protein